MSKHDDTKKDLPHSGDDHTLHLGSDSGLTIPNANAPAVRSQTPSKPAPAAGVPAELIADRFEVMRVLGEGGMGKVFVVRDLKVEGRLVALKLLRDRFSRNEQFRRLFFGEIKAAQQFVSPHVNQVRDSGEARDGRLYLTMDLVEGESLGALLAREHALLPRHALEIARQILLGLGSGHEKGYVHRDIKPSNVMLRSRVAKTEKNPFGVDVRVLDFGISGLAAEVSEGGITGTPTYMSPEQAQGEKLDARSDLFAVGIVLYEMIAGERPFTGDTLKEIETALLETNVGPKVQELQNLKKPIRKILVRALEKDREKRFQNAGEFIAAIEHSRAYKLPSEVPVWAWAAIAGLSVVAAARWMAPVSAGDSGEAAVLRTQLNQSQAAYLERQGELTSSTNDRAKLAEDHIKELAKKDGEIASLKSDLANEKQNYTLEKQESARKEQERQEISDRFNKLELENLAREKEILDLKDARLKDNQLLNPDVARAKLLDDLLKRIEEGHTAKLSDTYKSMVGTVGFDATGVKGARLVEALCHGFDALDRLGQGEHTGDTASASAFHDATAAADQVREARVTFEADARSWIGLEDSPTSPRVKRIDTALSRLDASIAKKTEWYERKHSDEWAELEGSVCSKPLAARDHQRAFRCKHLEAALAKCAPQLETELFPGGARIPAALEKAVNLTEWDRVVTEGKLLGDGARTIAQLSRAREFFSNNPQPAPMPKDTSELGLTSVSSRRKDWRWQLVISEALLAEKSPYPIAPGTKLVFRREVQPAGKPAAVTYEIVECDSRSANETLTWSLTKIFCETDGTRLPTQQTPKIQRRDLTFSISTNSEYLLDLGDEGLEVAPLPKLRDDPLPARLNIEIDAVSMTQFRNRFGVSKQPCLVYTRGETTHWISPEFGEVRLERTDADGSVHKAELVFSTVH